MARTQVYIGEEELAMLDRAAEETGATRSELIRRAVRRTYGAATAQERLRALESSAGSWKGRSFTGSGYVDSVRGDLDARLRSLGLE